MDTEQTPMLEAEQQTASRRRRAVRTAIVIGALVLAYYVIFIVSHLR